MNCRCDGSAVRSASLGSSNRKRIPFRALHCALVHSVKITPDDCAIYLPTKPAQMICYHVVIEGRLLVAVDGEPMIEVGAGEIVLFPQNDAHTLADERGAGRVSLFNARRKAALLGYFTEGVGRRRASYAGSSPARKLIIPCFPPCRGR